MITRWTHINIMRETLPGQAQYDDGWFTGWHDYAEFREKREFTDLRNPPSDAWQAGYRVGYEQAERGRR